MRYIFYGDRIFLLSVVWVEVTTHVEELGSIGIWLELHESVAVIQISHNISLPQRGCAVCLCILGVRVK